ncbi:MAG: helix-turn-helix transcriptional regulator, partial [Peptostreptococcaceae bacterium]
FKNKEKKLHELRNYMLEQIEERKIEYQDYKFDNSVYIRREKTLLQYIRTGSNENVMKLLPIIFSDIGILCSFDLELIKLSCIELMTMISRAAVDGGIETDLALNISRSFRESIDSYKNAEDLFANMNKTISTLLDMIYILGDNNQNSILKSARAYIEKNYNKKITIEKIAENSYVSTYYLCHLFKENLNLTINDYITRIRVEKSIELMKKRELSVNDIMKEVGFSSQSHFTKTFKKLVGVTPGSYRNKFL